MPRRHENHQTLYLAGDKTVEVTAENIMMPVDAIILLCEAREAQQGCSSTSYLFTFCLLHYTLLHRRPPASKPVVHLRLRFQRPVSPILRQLQHRSSSRRSGAANPTP